MRELGVCNQGHVSVWRYITSTTQEKILQSKVQKCSHHRASSPLEAYARQKRALVSCRFSFTHMSTYNTLHFLCFQSCFCHEEMLWCRIISSWKKARKLLRFSSSRKRKEDMTKSFGLFVFGSLSQFWKGAFLRSNAQKQPLIHPFLQTSKGV